MFYFYVFFYELKTRMVNTGGKYFCSSIMFFGKFSRAATTHEKRALSIESILLKLF